MLAFHEGCQTLPNLLVHERSLIGDEYKEAGDVAMIHCRGGTGQVRRKAAKKTQFRVIEHLCAGSDVVIYPPQFLSGFGLGFDVILVILSGF